MELEFLLVLSTFDRDLYRDESYGLHRFFLCGYCSVMHACRAMAEPAILHPSFMPFFTVYHCIIWIGLLGAESLHLVGVGLESGEGIVYIGFRKHTNTSTHLD